MLVSLFIPKRPMLIDIAKLNALIQLIYLRKGIETAKDQRKELQKNGIKRQH